MTGSTVLSWVLREDDGWALGGALPAPRDITTDLDHDDWLNLLGNNHMVTALLSSLHHQCTTIGIDGPSLRERQG